MANKFRFTNEKCPVCNNTFNTDDDIVVCPDCGTPHHRECYKENTKCANHEKHGEDFRWEPSFVSAEEAEKVKKPTEEKSIYQQALEMAEMPFPTIQAERINPFFREKFGDLEDGISAEDVAIFVRQESHRYVSKFKRITEGKLSWNWAAFFFTPYWFFYRKLYKIGAVIFAIFLSSSCNYSVIFYDRCPCFQRCSFVETSQGDRRLFSYYMGCTQLDLGVLYPDIRHTYLAGDHNG